jgi:hypothetical protein
MAAAGLVTGATAKSTPASPSLGRIRALRGCPEPIGESERPPAVCADADLASLSAVEKAVYTAYAQQIPVRKSHPDYQIDPSTPSN